MHQISFDKFILFTLLLISMFGCASQKRLAEDPQILSKMDAQLQRVISMESPFPIESQELHVLVRINSSIADSTLEAIRRLGHINSQIGYILTLVIKRNRVVRLAAIEYVDFIELSSERYPTQIPPR